MAAEMPARVQPVEGAEIVNFPWDAALDAVAAFNAAEATLGDQLGGRPAMVDTIVDWVGTYRDEFNSAYSRITGTGTGLKESLAVQASQIVGWAENANQAQRTNNDRAQSAA
jgi:hypothetical protein